MWRQLQGKKKGRVVTDIRGLNALTLTDIYQLPLQSEILALAQGSKYITVVDGSSFFFQWPVAYRDRHKLTVVSHRGQEQFNVAVMGYKNSVAFVQRQMENLLRPHKEYAKAYVDDIVIFSPTLQEHLYHLQEVFNMFKHRRIAISPTKSFIGYPSVQLLGQHVDSFGPSTPDDKLQAISKLVFPHTLKELESYLGMTGYLRQYIPQYAIISAPLQLRKTELLKNSPLSGHSRKNFTKSTLLQHPTEAEIASFEAIQTVLSKPRYLTHFDPNRQLYIDIDASPDGIGAITYHLENNLGRKECDQVKDSQMKIRPIMFLSRLLNKAEQNYWPTEMEMAAMVWVVRKCRHLIESAKVPTIIYTDHGSNTVISQQQCITTSTSTRINLRLVRASQYLHQFPLQMRHKPGKSNFIPDALSRLPNSDTLSSNSVNTFSNTKA
ncbi:hypothetical protein K3495_g5988 [Podosphaera aphanis]|nr:hypothetical protein K3495_g5988 [Podosphaera aphanis]